MAATNILRKLYGQMWIVVLVAGGLPIGGCVTTADRLNTVVDQYRAYPQPKALAIARDSDGAYAWGWAFASPSTDEATKRALSACRSRLAVYMVRADCVIYAINDEFVFRTQPDTSQASTGKLVTVTGTCFAITNDGVLITAYHVIKGATSISVEMSDGSSLAARVEQASEAVDLALLRVHHETPEYLDLADVGTVRVGARVFTFGFPAPHILGPEPKYSEGSISSLSGPAGEATVLQVTVPVQPGNSGGPLVDDEGRVVGIMTSSAAAIPFLRATGQLPQNVNWAINAAFARPLLRQPAPTRIEPASHDQLVARVRRAVGLVRATVPVE